MQKLQVWNLNLDDYDDFLHELLYIELQSQEHEQL